VGSALLDDPLIEVARLLPAMRARAAALDAQAAFPVEDIAALREAGFCAATLPARFGGAGYGIGPEGAQKLFSLLALLGEGHMAVARLCEAHVNAIHLVLRFGAPDLIAQVAADAAAGRFFGLWVTDPPSGGVRLAGDDRLEGRKVFCSGAGFLSRALITVATPEGTRMMILALPDGRAMPGEIALAGLRAAVTGAFDVSGLLVPRSQWLGEPGDYLREPVFSAGAWRAAAAAFGGLTALLNAHRAELAARRRDADPHQRARFGQAVIAHETARLWLARAAARACLEDGPAEEIVAYVNLARLAVESACLDALRLTQRSLGLSAFLAGGEVERLARDLATFLRQPAPDETLDKAAGFYLETGLPA
jgi:alkylation response protein AidB-like acyl-CoA dehydrogenase